MLAAEELLQELDNMDPGSVSFRYPESIEGEEVVARTVRANLRHLAEIAGRLSNFLTSCMGGLWNDLDQKETFLSDMREMYGHEES